MKTFVFLSFLVLATAVFFYPSFTNFLFQDDFFNIRLSQNQSLLSAINIFQKPILDFIFYRPLTTQLFWGTAFPIFGFQTVFYHLVTFAAFGVSVFFVYFLASLLSQNRKVCYLTAFFYAFSSTNFYRLFFLSQFQEIGLAICILLAIIFYIKNNRLSLLFFGLALMSKETAVVLPIILFAYDHFYRRETSKLLPHILLLAIYFVARIFFFGFATGSAYSFDLNPKHVLNNYFWYTLWSTGIPESFVNLKLFLVTLYNDLNQPVSFAFVNPALFTSFGIWGGPIILSFSLFVVCLFLTTKLRDVVRLFNKDLFFAGLIYVVFLLPVAFFPFHKFAYSLTVPIFGFSYLLANLIGKFNFKNMVFTTLFYFILSFFTTQYNLSQHWAATKAYTAQRVFDYLITNYPDSRKFQNIYFQNDDRNYCSTVSPGKDISQQVAYGIGGLEGLRLLYNQPNLEVYFYDLDKDSHLLADSLVLDSRLFLRR